MTQTQHVSFEIFWYNCFGLGSALEKKLNGCQAEAGWVTVSQNVTSHTVLCCGQFNALYCTQLNLSWGQEVFINS